MPPCTPWLPSVLPYPEILYSCHILSRYATLYTMAPVLSLVLDEDVSADIALMYPELYQDLMKGRSLTLKTFFIWVLISIYQGREGGIEGGTFNLATRGVLL